MIMAILQLAMASAPSEQMPPSCYAVEEHAPVPVPETLAERIEPASDELLRTMRRSSLGDPSDREELLRRVTTLWRKDSMAYEFAMARVAVDDNRSSVFEADVAATLYKRLSGRAGPMLSELRFSGAEGRQAIALQGITGRLSVPERGYVLGLACDALWQLQAFGAADVYARQRMISGTPKWPFVARGLVLAALPLLDKDPAGVELREAIRKVPL